PEILGGGYHYMKMNLKWKKDGWNESLPFMFHLGRGQMYEGSSMTPDSIIGYIDNSFNVRLPINTEMNEEYPAGLIIITMNIDRWFDGADSFDFSAYPMGIMQNQSGMFRAVTNGHQAFTASKIVKQEEPEDMICKRAPLFLFALISIGLFFSSCAKRTDSASGYKPTPYLFEIPFYFPQTLNIPADNPMTVEGVILGRYLFYDGRISGRNDPDSMMSCSTCHIQEHSFVCGIDHPKFKGGHPYGVTGLPTPHFMLPMINLAWTNNGYLWNGVVNGNQLPGYRNIEDIVNMAIAAPEEMHSDSNLSKKMIATIPGYPELFYKAFGSNIVTEKNIARAIAQFVRTLVSADSRFDRFLKGMEQLSDAERNGYVLFMTEQGADCFHCHGGDGNPLFTSNLFFNNGKDSIFTDPADRHAVSGNSSDIGAYKAPTLRNLVFTAPYMHDGRFKTIDEVINFYSSGLKWSPFISPLMHHITTQGVQLTPNEKSNLKAFLLTLTDSSFIKNPDFSRPATLPK
ncbi:MAG: cytochrome c peroxidase, partial [Bacteroidota bacterium]